MHDTYCCTNCKLTFDGPYRGAACPECGEIYDKFTTPLIRCGSFAMAYWMDANPDVTLRKHEPSNA